MVLQNTGRFVLQNSGRWDVLKTVNLSIIVYVGYKFMYIEVYNDNVVFIMCTFGFLRHVTFRVRCY